VWGGYLNAELTGQVNSFLRKCFKYGLCNAVAKVEQQIKKIRPKDVLSYPEPRALHSHPASTHKDSDRGSDQVVIITNYQWLPENYIINRLFPVPFSNTYYQPV